ncbi:hypothetical protein [Saccharopolyspora sp. NPDC002376]
MVVFSFPDAKALDKANKGAILRSGGIPAWDVRPWLGTCVADHPEFGARA